MPPPISFSLRSATREDAPLFYRVIDETMRELIIATWGRWDESRVQRESQEDCLASNAKVILSQDVGIGVLMVEKLQTHIQLEQIYLLPKYQGLGIGTALLNNLIEEAMHAHMPIRLQVMAINPAQRFYERLGFVVTEEKPDFVLMEKQP